VEGKRVEAIERGGKTGIQVGGIEVGSDGIERGVSVCRKGRSFCRLVVNREEFSSRLE